MAVFLQPTTVRDRPTMVRTTSVGVLSYTSHPSLRGVPSGDQSAAGSMHSSVSFLTLLTARLTA